MYIYGLWQLEGTSGTETFTGTSSVVLDPANERKVCDQEDLYFFGQLSNLSEVDLKLHLHFSKDGAKLHNHDLRAGESISIRGAPLWAIGVVINGSVILHGMGFIVKAETKEERERILFELKIEEDNAIRPPLANEQYFLQKKAEDGKLVIVTGSVAVDGIVCSYTPANGVTFTIVASRVNGASTADDVFTLTLINNATTVDQCIMSLLANTMSGDFHFISKGDQLIGDGVKRYKITCSDLLATTTVTGTILGYID